MFFFVPQWECSTLSVIFYQDPPRAPYRYVYTYLIGMTTCILSEKSHLSTSIPCCVYLANIKLAFEIKIHIEPYVVACSQVKVTSTTVKTTPHDAEHLPLLKNPGR